MFCSTSSDEVALVVGALGVDCVAGGGRIYTWSMEGATGSGHLVSWAVAVDSCHGRVSGINKICIRSSSYCRSQATAA